VEFKLFGAKQLLRFDVLIPADWILFVLTSQEPNSLELAAAPIITKIDYAQ
jgi:hypothetical protein